MSRKIKYTEGEIGEVEIVQDFLPPPKDLVLKKEAIKVTIALSRDSVNFFREQAAKHHIPYQIMIKNLLDRYTEHYKANDG